MTSTHNVPTLTWVLAAGSGGASVPAMGLLAAGSVTQNAALLSWGLCVAVLAIALGCLAGLRGMIDGAVRRCVADTSDLVQGRLDDSVRNTAIQVGDAIAEALRDDAARDLDPSVPQLYTGRRH